MESAFHRLKFVPFSQNYFSLFDAQIALTWSVRVSLSWPFVLMASRAPTFFSKIRMFQALPILLLSSKAGDQLPSENPRCLFRRNLLETNIWALEIHIKRWWDQRAADTVVSFLEKKQTNWVHIIFSNLAIMSINLP